MVLGNNYNNDKLDCPLVPHLAYGMSFYVGHCFNAAKNPIKSELIHIQYTHREKFSSWLYFLNTGCSHTGAQS